MFVYNWIFGSTKSPASTTPATASAPVAPVPTQVSPATIPSVTGAPGFHQHLTNLMGPNYHILSEGEYSTIMDRLSQLETLLKQKAEETRPVTACDSGRSTPLPTRPRPQTPHDAFQEELFARVHQLRSGMGASHGFGVGDFDELVKLEQSICMSAPPSLS